MTLRYAGYVGTGLILGAALASACGGESSDTGLHSGGASTGGAGIGGAGTCAPGDTRVCVGPGACQGGQTCSASGEWDACDCGSGGSGSGGSGGAGGAGGSGGTGTGGSAPDAGDGALNPDAACAVQKFQASFIKTPVDVIFVVDNSCSMAEEMKAIQDNINTNFAQVLGSLTVDYRVIVIGEHGGYNTPSSYESSICISPPLGGAPCTGVLQNTAPTNNPPVFYHYDHDDVESWDAWCKMLDWYKQPDRYNLAPGGWSQWLRKEALKTFVLVSDDRMDCQWPSTAAYYSSCAVNGPSCYDDGTASSYLTDAPLAAQNFDTDLLALDPLQFGTATKRNYVWHSLVGVSKNTANATGEYPPTDGLVASKCATAVNSGPGSQALSMLTGGLRYPVCEGVGFDVVFKKIAESVVKGVKIACTFDVPAPPAGKTIDPKTLMLAYTPSAGGSPEAFTQVNDATQCKAGSFYLTVGSGGGDAGGSSIVLCPETCTKIQSDAQAKLEVLAFCAGG
ncbi:MAG: hypothetical protein HS104_30350 [Polyangiaceae bacterium]|nr:hypothetical protein [Polyangiaceae bacterium]MCL4753454.1 hypothetical protein [Myxococcales bacterium]